MSFSSLALVRYEGSPQVPYLIYGHVTWNGAPLSLARLKITNEDTGFTKDITTDGSGYWQETAGNWLTIASGRPPTQYGDVIRVTATDGCGAADVCTRIFNAYYDGYKDFAVVDLSLSGELVCPPASCPSCSGGTCDGSGTCYCPDDDCPTCDECDERECPEPEVCPAVEECPVVEDIECPEDECSDSPTALIAIIVGILSAAGGAGAFFGLFNNKIFTSPRTGMKTYRGQDGELKIHHKHPGTTGYHCTTISHRAPETHPKGKVDVANHYFKNDKGLWEYSIKKVA